MPVFACVFVCFTKKQKADPEWIGVGFKMAMFDLSARPVVSTPLRVDGACAASPIRQ
jgi:hypothetical protein